MKYKKSLCVLEIGEWDFAGCGFFLSQAINQHTDSKARSVRYHPSTLSFPYDLQAPSDDVLRDLWKRADVIHIHDDYRPLPTGLQAKPTVVTYHGSLYRASPKEYNDRAREQGWVQTVATLDLCITSGLRWMPDTRPDLSQYVNRSPVFKVCHAPTKRKIKGTDAVLTACRRTADLDLIENVPWDDALRRKGQCWATIDQFILGYGCNAIEAWMMGQPVIGGASDKRILDAIEKQAGYLPFVLADGSVESIRQAIIKTKDEGDNLGTSAHGKVYVDKFHSMRAVAGVAMAYYHEAMEAFYSRGAVVAPLPAMAPAVVAPRRRGRKVVTKKTAGKDVLVQYLGDSAGWMPIEINGRTYRFSAGKPVQTVLPEDVAALLEIRERPRHERGKRKLTPGKPLFRRIA